jgi:hypothetical protein
MMDGCEFGLGGMHEDAKHPGALPALEAKGSGGGRMEDLV